MLSHSFISESTLDSENTHSDFDVRTPQLNVARLNIVLVHTRFQSQILESKRHVLKWLSFLYMHIHITYERHNHYREIC